MKREPRATGTIPMTFHFTEAQYQRLRAIARAEGLSVPDTIRWLLKIARAAAGSRGCSVVAGNATRRPRRRRA